jgi:DNA-binding GntR family transcriptional regulator
MAADASPRLVHGPRAPGGNSADDDVPPESLGLRLTRTLRLLDRREPLVATMVEWVALGIIEGRLAPGEVLSSVELAGQFNSSRTPVREALMVLEQEGLVEMRARRRPRVAQPTLQEVQDTYQVRQHLLALGARLVVDRATDSEIEEAGRRVADLRQMADAGQVDAYFWAHVDLQEFLMQVAGNSTLKQILDSLALRTLVLRHRSLSQPGRLRESVEDQERMYRAYVDRDADLAAALMAGSTLSALRAIERWHLETPAAT